MTPRMSADSICDSVYLLKMHFRRIGQGPSQNLPTFPSPSTPPTHTLSHTHAPAKPRPCPCLLAASLHTGSILPGHGLRVSVCAFVCVFKSVLAHTEHGVYREASVYVCQCASKAKVVRVSCFLE